MTIFTRAQKETQLAIWREALERVADAQEYRIGSRTLTMSDLSEIRQTLEWLESQSTAEDVAAGRGPLAMTPMIPARPGGGY